MLPWEHAAAGYLAYSLSVRALRGRPPTGPEAVAVVLATLLPDLIDKPLAWELQLVNGKSLGHSLSFALPATALTGWLAGRGPGSAVGVGLASHAAGDVAYAYGLAGRLDWTFLLWPAVDRPVPDASGLLATTRRWLATWGEVLASPAGRAYLLAELSLLGGAAILWQLDGRPGPGTIGALFGRETDPLEGP